MLLFDRIDVSEGIDVSKTSESNEWDVCHYWYFLNKGVKFQPNISNGCHDLLMVSMNLRNIAILNIKSTDYCCIISGISKSESIHLMRKGDLTKKKPNIIKHKNLLSHIKMGEEILTFGNIEAEKNIFYCHKAPSF